MNSATLLLVPPVSPPAVPRPASEVETELFTAIMRGLPGWQSRAYHQYQSLVRGLIVKSLGPKGDIEDILGDVFLRFLENARRIRSAEGIRSYLVSITMNSVRREARKRKRRALFQRFFAGSDEMERRPSLDDPKAKAALIQLSRILDELSTNERAAFVLRCMEGLPIAEVADVLRISESTAKRRARRASERVLKRVSRNALLADYVRDRTGLVHDET
ncbi:MAG TPA: sigma-70 family RNA polymerase sigma factor [Polyangiaceae bacterium]|nr:sigma-70 family RNA polymerase sigma factor [Polyangiaceae bacterium]